MCRRRDKLVKKTLFPTNAPQDQIRFPSPVIITAREITSLTGLPPTVLLVGYTAVLQSAGVSVILRAFSACEKIGRNFFSPPTEVKTKCLRTC